ncbi:MAG TPA: ComEC/Rec2 family competence protein [Acidimicrobiales bacterium]|nr:ComEC/Rec2 family competence protein [Acidimicrobiales bacterium]
MSDAWAVALAGCAALGAWASHPAPVWPAAVVAAVALAARRPALLCAGVLVLASGLGARSWAGLDPPPTGTQMAGRATLVTDPVERWGAVRVELRIGGRRVEAWAHGSPARTLRGLLAGDTVPVAGRLAPLRGPARSYLARRHVAARLSVTQAGRPGPGNPLAGLANDVRRTLLHGVASLPPERRALFAGFVLGDDRDQDPVSVDDFRAAGLSHLLAVSGENVAFVLALAGPALRLLGLRGRLLAGLAVLVFFGVLTRWEPSVLRASAMAAVTMLAAAVGRPASTLRVLALAVAGLLLVDPLLVGSVGFQLSCAACAGIAVLAGPLSRRLPLPLAVTLAAQAGVAPVLVGAFGGVPVASVPANLLAAPAAGPVMVWGLAAGLPAGLLGGRLAALVHVPTGLLVGWIALVARWAAGLPLGQLGPRHLAVLAAAGGVAAVPPLRRPAVVAAVAVCLLPSVVPVGAVDGRPLDGGGRLWRRGSATVLVVDRPRAGPLLEALRGARVRGLSVLAVTGPGDVALILRRHPARVVLAAGEAADGTTVTAGGLRVSVTATEPRLVVAVSRAPPG